MEQKGLDEVTLTFDEVTYRLRVGHLGQRFLFRRRVPSLWSPERLDGGYL